MNKRVRTVLLLVVLLVIAGSLSGCAQTNGTINLYQPNDIWDAVVKLVARALIWLSEVIGSLGIPYQMGWAIIVFTIVMKVVTLPLTLKQLQSTKATQELQPKLAELQQKYGKDRQKLSEEQMKLYKEAGVNPLGGCLPLLIQMPVLFALYQALYMLANPSVGKLAEARFFWIPDLSLPSLTKPVTATPGGVDFQGNAWIMSSVNQQQWGILLAYLSLPVIMILTQLILQKMSTPVPVKGGKQDEQQRMMGQMMLFMPIMFGYITLGLPSGLTLYWSVSNILSLVQQYFITGWGSLVQWIPQLETRSSASAPAIATETETAGPGPAAAQLDKAKRRRRRK